MLASSLFSLFALSSATYVTETEWATFYVTVGPDGVAVPVPQSATSAASSVSAIVAEATPSVVSSNAAAGLAQTFVVGGSTTVLSWPAKTSSSSQAPAAPSTTSTSQAPAPSTTSQAPTTSPEAPATTTSSEAPQSTATGLEADILNYHNKVRAEHHVGSLTWSDTLAAYAQKYLDNSNCVFAHSGGPYGENIAIGYPTIDAAEDAWYNEEDQYDYAAGQFGENTGHFTQMVWKGSNQVGCATIDCSGSTFLACEYSPAGNVIGQFTENVFPK